MTDLYDYMQPDANNTADNIIPCDCGSDQANWRGDKYGLRMYLCPDCADHYPELLAAENY